MIRGISAIQPLSSNQLSMAVASLVRLLLVLHVVQAHVSLTYPPARRFDLDFLDSIRTVGPCGMNRGNVKTTILAGQDLKVTWHLGYPHEGGFLIQLLDNQELPLQNLTQGFEGGNDVHAQEYTVTIPAGLQCPDCSIRLLRQALNWGPNYIFHSCADVDIVTSPSAALTQCSGNGSPSSSGCACKRMYTGHKCQYLNDCDTDSDCNNVGRCIENQGTGYPKKECYCSAGYHGRNCELESVLRDRNFTEKNYAKVDLSPRVRFLWRYVDGGQTEMEGILVGHTTSYLAIGWRSESLAKTCQNFPTSAPAPRGQDFHAMDCQDIVVGKANGGMSNIGDYYTRDRSTPRRDEYYGGKSDITAAIGWEEDGVTTIMFRKKVDSGEQTDHEFFGRLKLIWAHGQTDSDFYGLDELKYHGSSQRGQITIPAGSGPGLSEQRQILIAAMVLMGVWMAIQVAHSGYLKFSASSKKESSGLPMGSM